MDKASQNLALLLNQYFGSLGEALASREIKSMGFEGISAMSDQNKKVLAEKIIKNVFSEVFSANKCSTIRSRLYSILNLSEHAKKSLNSMAELDYYSKRD